MEIVGHIQSADSERPLSRDVWRTLIADTDDLAGIEPRSGRNPFTGEPVLFHAPDDSVNLLINAIPIGGFSWAMDDSSIINVDAIPEHVDSVVRRAKQLAEAIDCRFVHSGGEI